MIFNKFHKLYDNIVVKIHKKLVNLHQKYTTFYVETNPIYFALHKLRKQ